MSNNVDDGVEGSKPLSDETDNRQDQEFSDRTFAKIEAKFLVNSYSINFSYSLQAAM